VSVASVPVALSHYPSPHARTRFHYLFPYAVLSNAQVAVILQMSKGNAVNRDEELNEVYRKTLKYVMRFNTMSNPEKQNQEVVDELDNLQEYVLAGLLMLSVVVVQFYRRHSQSCSLVFVFS
jgi:hypothetical protein